MEKTNIIEFGKEVIKLQSESIRNLVELVDENFETAINLILDSKGRVVVTGIGKSAIIANKIVATLNSTGTPSIFMHAADAIHGDLGIIKKDDVLLIEEPGLDLLNHYNKNFGSGLIQTPKGLITE